MSDVGIVLLAAGGSRRMGRPKQLLAVAGRSLLRRAAAAAIESGCRPVVVVLGAHAEDLGAELRGLSVEVVVNDAWERGIGTSIRRGIAHLTSGEQSPRAALIMLCDQPLVTASVLRRVVSAHAAGGRPVAAAAYDKDAFGPPVVVSAAIFPALLGLGDDRGAKDLWLGRPEIVHRVACPEAGVDVDTPSDYQRLLERDGSIRV